MKFLSYFFPKKTKFGNVTAYHLFNKMWVPYPKKLEWVSEKGTEFSAERLDGKHYLVGSLPHSTLFYYCGPELNLGYRSSLDEAAKVCERHYRRTVLGLD